MKGQFSLGQCLGRTGLGQYQAVRAGMDLLVRADHLELLLSKRSGSGASADIGAPTRILFTATLSFLTLLPLRRTFSPKIPTPQSR